MYVAFFDHMNARRKGKLGELEFAALLRAQGFTARRGQQFAGVNIHPTQ
jgi:hypothetical protein